ncbi:MAG: DUF1622 domain-containing protein [Pseudomonadota bacterium]
MSQSHDASGWMHTFDALLEVAAQIIDVVGIIILLIAAIKFVFRYLSFEFAKVRGTACVGRLRELRLELGSYILLALEFMIISDVIHSALSRTLDDFIILGALVLVRSAISFFLGLDLKEVREEAESDRRQPQQSGSH